MSALVLRRSQFITTYGPRDILESHAGPGVITALGKSNVFTTNRSIQAFEETDESQWYSGVELFGEGLHIDLAPFTNPNRRHITLTHAQAWQKAWQNPARYHQRLLQPEDRDYLHPVFVWWHTLAYRLINALSVDSGSPFSAVRERVFIDMKEQNDLASGGILLYTVQPGEDCILRGPIALVARFGRVLRAALNTIDTCWLQRTSCEHHNTRLDRRLLKDNLPCTVIGCKSSSAVVPGWAADLALSHQPCTTCSLWQPTKLS